MKRMRTVSVVILDRIFYVCLVARVHTHRAIVPYPVPPSSRFYRFMHTCILFWVGAMSANGLERVGLTGFSSPDESLTGAATGTANTSCSQRMAICPLAESAFQPATPSVEASASLVENIPQGPGDHVLAVVRDSQSRESK